MLVPSLSFYMRSYQGAERISSLIFFSCYMCSWGNSFCSLLPLPPGTVCWRLPHLELQCLPLFWGSYSRSLSTYGTPLWCSGLVIPKWSILFHLPILLPVFLYSLTCHQMLKQMNKNQHLLRPFMCQVLFLVLYMFCLIETSVLLAATAVLILHTAEDTKVNRDGESREREPTWALSSVGVGKLVCGSNPVPHLFL